MTGFELTRVLLQPFGVPLHQQVRRELIRFAREHNGATDVLDVGGRKSHYTIAVPARIHITDIARKSDIQRQLHLGINSSIVQQTQRRRSNVHWVVFDDMTSSSIRENSFDCVVAVEVLEHVERDRDFVTEVARVIKPGGMFLMTTPNGDYVANRNPDHKRHYRKAELDKLLGSVFAEVEIRYAIKSSRFRRWGLQSWSPTRPVRTVMSMAGNLINRWQSFDPRLAGKALGTHHLIARAIKARS
jgi:ubiquinone/menaquinone biosynthesis C-methylase UbiE